MDLHSVSLSGTASVDSMNKLPFGRTQNRWLPQFGSLASVVECCGLPVIAGLICGLAIRLSLTRGASLQESFAAQSAMPNRNFTPRLTHAKFL